ncbi:MAG: DHHA1 domain-containing protein [Clostridium sp.]
MKIKLFSHTDLDGVGCNIVVKSTFENMNFSSKVDCENLNYDTIDNTIENFIINEEYKDYDLIFVTDISVNEDVAELIENTCKDKMRLLDHHPTALHLNKYSWAIVDIERDNEKTCSTTMIYDELGFEDDYLYGWVECIRKYDTWLWKEKYNDIKSKELNDLFFILGKEKFIAKALECIKDEVRVERFIEKHRALLDEKQKQIDEYVENKNKTLMKINKGSVMLGVVFAEHYHSELGNRLSETNQDCDLIMIINGNKVSLRTVRDDVNCGEIAKLLGGGGHPKASGFMIKDNIMLSFFNNILSI